MYRHDPQQVERNLLLALIISGLLHVLLLILFRHGLESDQYILPDRPLAAYPDSIQARYPRFRYIPIELIETPEIVKERKSTEPTRFLSDKSAEAADRRAQKDLPQGLPYSEGNTKAPVFQGGDGLPPGQPEPSAEPALPQQGQSGGEQLLADASGGGAAQSYDGNGLIPFQQLRRRRSGDSVGVNTPASQDYKPFSRDILHNSGGSGGSRTFANDGQYDNRMTTAPEFGDVSLSTYAWEWAPYIEYMRRRLREHIFPPPAFYQMGAISGEVQLQFRLRRDGAVEGLKTLGYRGHVALVQTSLNAVRGSNPFKALPANFPEEYLEMTWIFYYVLR
jgi:hypothetical protein